MALRFTYVLMIGIPMAFFKLNMGLVWFMMLKASLILGFLQSSRMVSGCGGLLGLICLRFKVNRVWFQLVVKILLNELFQNLVSFSCSNTQNPIRIKHNQVELWDLVWFSLSIPKQAFVTWLVMIDTFW